MIVWIGVSLIIQHHRVILAVFEVIYLAVIHYVLNYLYGSFLGLSDSYL